MASQRLAEPAGTWIDRSHPLSFTFNGRQLYGFKGDTLASALLANGVRLVGRSFKLHRPRGIWSCGVEEPGALSMSAAVHAVRRMCAPRSCRSRRDSPPRASTA